MAVNEAAPCLVCDTRREHKEERQDRKFLSYQKPDRSSTDNGLVNTHIHTVQHRWRENGEAEQCPGNVRLEAERRKGVL